MAGRKMSAERSDSSFEDDKLRQAPEQVGVQAVEAAQSVWTKKLRIAVYISLALAAYVYSLEAYCSAVWTYRVTSAFGQHSLLSAIGTAQAIIIAIGKIFHSKFSDVCGRAWGFALCMFLYTLGFIIIASATWINAYAAGIVFYAAGYTGLQINLQVIIADVTTLRFRGLTTALFTAPFLINFAVGAQVAAHFAPTITDFTAPVYYTTLLRWGFGMFAIIFPCALAPIIITLFWGEHQAKKQGILQLHKLPAQNIFKKVYTFLVEMDIVGVLLLTAGLGLILEPISLAGRTFGVPILSWNDAHVLAPCFVIGALCWPALIFWELKFAKYPYLPLRVLKNRSVIGACIFSFFDFVSFYLQYPYLASFIAVTTSWSASDQNYFLYTQTVALTFFGILFGLLVVFTRRYKWVVFVGLAIRLIGVACMIAARSRPGDTAGLVMTQIVQGLGGGIAAIGGQLAAQASVPHQDTATVTALVLLAAEVGNAVGNAIAGAIWRSKMPVYLQNNLAGLLSQTDIETVYSSAVAAATYPMGSAIRDAIITSYLDIMHVLLIAATVLAIPPLIGALMLHDYRTTDTQNAVEGRDLKGNLVEIDSDNLRENKAGMLSRNRRDSISKHSA